MTFSAPAAPAARLLPELSKAVGIELTTDARLAKEVLLVKVKDVPRDELLARIAAVTGGEWESREGVYRLSLSGATDAKQRKAEAVVRGEEIRAGLTRLLKVYERVKDIEPRGKVETVISRLPADLLGGIGPGQRLVLSTHPTPMQRLLPAAAIQGVNLAGLRRTPKLVVGDKPAPPPGAVAMAMLVLRYDRDREGVSGMMATADAAGERIASESASPVHWDEVPSPRASTLPKPDAILTLPPKWVEFAKESGRLSAQTLAEAPVTEESQSDPLQTPYSHEELSQAFPFQTDALVLNPESHEPLATILGAGLTQLADAQDLNLVGVLPDSAFGPASTFFGNGPVRASDLESMARKALKVDLKAQDGWITLTPLEPAFVRGARADRVALGKVLRKLAKDHNLSLQEQADYAAAQPLGFLKSGLEGSVISLVDPVWGRRMAASSIVGERQLLRLYRALGPNPLAGARSFGSLPSSAKPLMEDWLFNANVGPTFQFRTTLSDGTPSLTERSDAGVFGPENLGIERTVYFERGIPTDATFRVVSDAREVYFGLAPSGVRPALTGVGTSVAITAINGAPVKVATNAPRLDAYLPGRIATISLELSVPRVWSFSRSLHEAQIDPTARRIAFRDMPEKVRNQVQAAEDSVRRSLQQMEATRRESGNGGANNPPPVPHAR